MLPSMICCVKSRESSPNWLPSVYCDVAYHDCQNCRVSRPDRDAQNKLHVPSSSQGRKGKHCCNQQLHEHSTVLTYHLLLGSQPFCLFTALVAVFPISELPSVMTCLVTALECYLLTGSLTAGSPFRAVGPGPTLVQHRLHSPGLAVLHLAACACTHCKLRRRRAENDCSHSKLRRRRRAKSDCSHSN